MSDLVSGRCETRLIYAAQHGIIAQLIHTLDTWFMEESIAISAFEAVNTVRNALGTSVIEDPHSCFEAADLTARLLFAAQRAFSIHVIGWPTVDRGSSLTLLLQSIPH